MPIVEKLGKYEIVEKIGVGGFGVVYKGYDPFIKRHVAIKTCSAEDQETRERFLREAEIAGNLQHRNIVTVFEFGFQDETPYLVQEFLTGEDLDHKIKRRDALPLSDKLGWLIEIARGLDFAHQRGVVHRDIKPANIRILHDSSAKILDFGIAKLAQHQSTLTQAGVTLGTASFLAPEQIRGEPVDGRTDLFSLGVLAYEMYTYERPFRAQEISALFYKLLNDEAAPMSSRTAGIPPELERIVSRCLEKDPEKRWSNTSELVRELERLERRPAGGFRPDVDPERTGIAIQDEKTTALSTTAATVVQPTPRALDPEETLSAGVALHDVKLETPASGVHGESHGMSPPRFSGRGRLARLLVGAALAGVIGAFVLLVAQDRIRIPAGDADTAAGAAPAERDRVVASGPETAAARPSDQPALVPAPAETSIQEATAITAAVGEPEPSSDAPSSGAASTPREAPPAPPAPAESSPEPAPKPAPVVEQPRPEPPKRGRLLIGPAWDPGMIVVVDGQRYRLDREQTIERPAGSVALSFSLQTPAYSFEHDLRLRLAPGASERVSIPIEKPGRLTVQPHLNTRGGTVRIDGAIAGPTPLRGRWLAPGEHFVEVFPLGEAIEPGFAQSVAVRSDAETIVTFDLDGSLEPTIRDKPAGSP
jgi:serine/threonine-protein kinase